MCKTVAQFAAACSSGRIANQGLFCQAKRLPAGVITDLIGKRLRGKIDLGGVCSD
jgi:hypothetical protein